MDSITSSLSIPFSKELTYLNHYLAIPRIRSRLKLQSGGDLEIQSTPNVGTTVTLTTPRENDLNEHNYSG